MSVNGEVADDGGEEATSGEIEERIEDFKQDKARQKSSFTRIKNKLLRMLDEKDYPSRREIKEMCHSGKLRHGSLMIQSKSNGGWSISGRLSSKKMRLCQIHTCVVSVN